MSKNQTVRHSGIVESNDGKYFYWKCTVSGIATFANAERFKKVLAKFDGDEKRLFNEFVSRPAQKYLDTGYTAEQIRETIKTNGGTLPKLPDPKATSQKVVKVATPVKPKVVGEAVPEPVKEPEVYADGGFVRKTYSWSHDPQHYFIT